MTNKKWMNNSFINTYINFLELKFSRNEGFLESDIIKEIRKNHYMLLETKTRRFFRVSIIFFRKYKNNECLYYPDLIKDNN